MAIIVRGDSQFDLLGPRKFQRSGWELDRAIAKYQGDRESLEAFLDTASWSLSPIDGHMYLEQLVSDDDPVKPSVELVWIGKKGGTLPPARHSKSTTIQQVQYSLLVAGEGQSFTIELTYVSEVTSKRVWSRSDIDISTIGAYTPADVDVVWWVAQWQGGTPDPLPDSEAHVLSYFYQREAVTGECDEVVPNQYFVATQNRQNLLFSAGS